MNPVRAKTSKGRKNPTIHKKFDSDDEDSFERAVFDKENDLGGGYHRINIDAIDEMEGVRPGDNPNKSDQEARQSKASSENEHSEDNASEPLQLDADQIDPANMKKICQKVSQTSQANQRQFYLINQFDNTGQSANNDAMNYANRSSAFCQELNTI